MLPGMPPVIDDNIYSQDQAGMMNPVVQNDASLVYVPNTLSDTVSVINPTTYQVIATYQVGQDPQHVVPSYDLRTLWVLNDESNSVTEINPVNGQLGQTIQNVTDPYNMYFTPNGRSAIVVEEANQILAFRDPQTMALENQVQVNCPGIDHMDFTLNGLYAIATCEYSGRLVKINVETEQVVGYLNLGSNSMPQDIRTSPDGSVMYVADMTAGGVWVIDPTTFKVVGFVKTGEGPHGLYPSRDGKLLYVSNRGVIGNTITGDGSISVISFATGKVVATWPLPHPSSPDMGGVSADGKVLWLSGRYNGVVYAIDTTTGQLIHAIPVGQGPHGLCVFPQPGRYSTGHTGEFR